MATDSERYGPSSSPTTGTRPDEFFARNSGMRLWPAKMSTSSSETRCPFLPRRCERGADLAPLHDCKASQDGPFQSLPNTVDFVLLPITDECQPNMSHRSLFCATKSKQIVHDRTIG